MANRPRQVGLVGGVDVGRREIEDVWFDLNNRKRRLVIGEDAGRFDGQVAADGRYIPHFFFQHLADQNRVVSADSKIFHSIGADQPRFGHAAGARSFGRRAKTRSYLRSCRYGVIGRP